MNQKKIGEFIASLRKKQNLTQEQLAEKLNLTAKAVSKWETGKGLPDASIMTELCNILNISVNELLSGELIENNKYNPNTEKVLLEMIKDKEASDQRLLKLEVLIGIYSLIPFFISLVIFIIIPMKEWLAATIILTSLIPLLIATPILLRIEQIAGYYECSECKDRYIPSYKSVFFARHIGKKRYMKCPNCQKKTWNNKKISK